MSLPMRASTRPPVSGGSASLGSLSSAGSLGSGLRGAAR